MPVTSAEGNGMRDRLVLLAVFGLLLAACGSGESGAEADVAAGNTAAAVVNGSPTSASPAAASQQTTPTSQVASIAPKCPNPHGGVCRGPLAAGSYSTASFSPAISYTVPDGWTNLEDLPGNFLLQKPGDDRYLGIYQHVRAPAECEEAWADGVGGRVDDLVTWYTTHPGLVTTTPEEVIVGGLTGVFLDISLDSSWDVTCPFSEEQPVVPFIIGNGTSLVHHVILPGFEARLFLLEWNGGNVAIEVGPEGTSLDDYLTEVLPIVESMDFAA